MNIEELENYSIKLRVEDYSVTKESFLSRTIKDEESRQEIFVEILGSILDGEPELKKKVMERLNDEIVDSSCEDVSKNTKKEVVENSEKPNGG